MTLSLASPFLWGQPSQMYLFQSRMLSNFRGILSPSSFSRASSVRLSCSSLRVMMRSSSSMTACSALRSLVSLMMVSSFLRNSGRVLFSSFSMLFSLLSTSSRVTFFMFSTSQQLPDLGERRHPGEAFDHGAARRPPQRLAEIGGLEKLRELLRELVHVPRREEHPLHIVLYVLADIPHRGAHHRASAGHGFQRRKRRRLGERGQHIDVHRLQVGDDIVLRAEQPHPALRCEFPDDIRLPVAEGEELRGGEALPHPREGAQQGQRGL